MDPNEALRRIRELLTEKRLDDVLDSDLDNDKSGEAGTVLVELSTLFEGLDGWLKNGGFMPTDWANKRIQEDVKELTVQVRDNGKLIEKILAKVKKGGVAQAFMPKPGDTTGTLRQVSSVEEVGELGRQAGERFAKAMNTCGCGNTYRFQEEIDNGVCTVCVLKEAE